MTLDLLDLNIRARVFATAPHLVHLNIRYPNTPEYRDRVLGALADILRPAGILNSKQPSEVSADE